MKSVRTILSAATRELDETEIYNELICIFIGKILNKYKPIHDHRYKRGVNFLHYMTQIFRFRVKDWCYDLLMRQLQMIDGPLDETQFQCYDKQEDIEKLDMDWIADPLSEAFQQLTIFERYLLYMTYVQGMTSEEIAKNLGRGRDSICLNLNTAKSKLRSFLNESGDNRD